MLFLAAALKASATNVVLMPNASDRDFTAAARLLSVSKSVYARLRSLKTLIKEAKTAIKRIGINAFSKKAANSVLNSSRKLSAFPIINTLHAVSIAFSNATISATRKVQPKNFPTETTLGGCVCIFETLCCCEERARDIAFVQALASFTNDIQDDRSVPKCHKALAVSQSNVEVMYHHNCRQAHFGN